MTTIHLIEETECGAFDSDPRMESGIPRVIEAHRSKDAAVAALAAWASATGACSYPGGPEHAFRVSDGEWSTYRLISETELVD